MKPAKPIESLILTVRGQKVILDTDLAALYEVPTKRLNEQIKRNADRFPEDFMFRLTGQEWDHLKSQIATSSAQEIESAGDELAMRSQIATTSHGGRRKLPHAFTEHGALQAANILKSDRAAAMSVFVIRAFVQMREHLAASAAVLQQLAAMDRKLLEHDDALVTLWKHLKPLLTPPPPSLKRRIGFKP
jgi:hypothetical protein